MRWGRLTTIVLGPWASVLAISVALLIQAVLFGDGGITTLGANCLNMAVAGSFVAHAVYRLVAGRSPVDSRRRVVAAALAGYLATNAAAFSTAIEFGVQPAVVPGCRGRPVYAPYPLEIAVPAMMLGHLTVAGFGGGGAGGRGGGVAAARQPRLAAATPVPADAPAPAGAALRPLWSAWPC